MCVCVCVCVCVCAQMIHSHMIMQTRREEKETALLAGAVEYTDCISAEG